MSLQLVGLESLDVYRWSLLGSTLTRFFLHANTGVKGLHQYFNRYNTDDCYGYADDSYSYNECINIIEVNRERTLKNILLEAWAIPFDIFNLWFSLASNSLDFARSIFAPIITLGIFIANIAFTCYFLWEDVMMGSLFLAPIFNILGFWDILGDPLGILYDENL